MREELERVLASREFHSSKLCQNFLRYVVENTLKGQTDNLKERTIGIEVFGKPVTYDPSEDAGVRVKAGEVRKRLRSYYLSSSADARIVIDLPPGTYVPEFRFPQEKPVSAKPTQDRSRWPLFALGSILVLIALAVSAFYWIRQQRAAGPLDQFWSPIFQSHKEVFVCTVPVPVYSDIRNSSSNPPPGSRISL